MLYQTACYYTQSEENHTGKIGAASFGDWLFLRLNEVMLPKLQNVTPEWKMTEKQSIKRKALLFLRLLPFFSFNKWNIHNKNSEKLQHAQRSLTKTNSGNFQVNQRVFMKVNHQLQQLAFYLLCVWFWIQRELYFQRSFLSDCFTGQSA